MCVVCEITSLVEKTESAFCVTMLGWLPHVISFVLVLFTIKSAKPKSPHDRAALVFPAATSWSVGRSFGHLHTVVAAYLPSGPVSHFFLHLAKVPRSTLP